MIVKVDEDVRIEGVERGVDVYLLKLFNDRELFVEVRNLLVLKENEWWMEELNFYLIELVLWWFLLLEMVWWAVVGELVVDFILELRLVIVLFSDIVGFIWMLNIL